MTHGPPICNSISRNIKLQLCRHPAMSCSSSTKASARVVSFLAAATARQARQTSVHRVTRNHGSRTLFASTRRWQQISPATSATTSSPLRPPPPATATANTAAAQHDLSPSSQSDPLRSLTDGLQDPPPVLGENEKQVDWTRSYHGLSSTPFTTEQAAILQQEIKFDDIEIKPDGIIYLPEIKYRRILNKAFRPGGWGLVPRGETIVTGKLVTREYGLVCGGR